MDFERPEPEAKLAKVKKNAHQGFLPAELLSFIGFGPEFIRSYNQYIQGKHCSFVNELIDRNMSKEREEMNEQKI